MNNNSSGLPFGSVGKRFMKFAEKKLQKGINYLEAQANSANTAYTTNPYNLNNPNPYNAQPSIYSPTSNQAPTSGSQNYNSAPPPPVPFSEPFPQPETSGAEPPESANNSFNPHPSNPIKAALFNAAGPIITQDLLFQMQSRLPSACKSLGPETVIEARKGLSRPLVPTHGDIELFGEQLKNSLVDAVEPNWNTLDDTLPCFAITYVQHPRQGRYKFSDEQWQNFHRVVEAITHTGIKQFRVWLDQCLWIRDASQASWAHTGILPYVLWPVIALGAKLPGGERTTDSFVRMWPFIEQISALWGLGLIIASEYRAKDQKSGTRPWLTYNLRLRTEPEIDLGIILLNVFHGATDGLKTGWKDDVRELKEMAHANVMYSNKNVIIGSDWKDKFISIEPSSSSAVVQELQMPVQSKWLGGVNIYLDGSRALKSTSWNGVREWLSGNKEPIPASQHDVTLLEISMNKYNLITDNAEYQLLQIGAVTSALWLLVAMHGRSSYFSRGRVAWTKVVSGRGSCKLEEMFQSEDVHGIQRVLREQLNNPELRIRSATKVDAAIEWM